VDICRYLAGASSCFPSPSPQKLNTTLLESTTPRILETWVINRYMSGKVYKNSTSISQGMGERLEADEGLGVVLSLDSSEDEGMRPQPNAENPQGKNKTFTNIHR